MIAAVSQHAAADAALHMEGLGACMRAVKRDHFDLLLKFAVILIAGFYALLSKFYAFEILGRIAKFFLPAVLNNLIVYV